jgi:HAD superfamily hydrolase (TIGR01490 family)
MDTRRALALFDFDGTLVHGDSIVAFVRFARARGIIKRREFAAACLYGALTALRLTDAARAKGKALSFLSRMTPEAADALCRQFAEQALLPALYPQGLEAMQRHADAGDTVLIVTASPERYMRALAGALPVHEIIATRQGTDGAITQNCRGEAKADRIREWLALNRITADFAASHAYGNSTGDLPMLRMAGHPHLVNPGRALRRRTREMPVLRWGEGDATRGRRFEKRLPRTSS